MGKNIIAMVLLLFLTAIFGCSSGPTATQTENAAPGFELQDLDGKTVSLSSLKGSPVMLNFWATWCGPCQSEMPFIQEVYEDSNWKESGLVILAVNTGEPASDVKEFMSNNSLTFTVLLDEKQDVSREYNIRYIPTTFFIDKNGIIKEQKPGAFFNKQEIEESLNNLMRGT